MNVPSILGSFLVGFGIMGIVWFVRRLFDIKSSRTGTHSMAIHSGDWHWDLSLEYEF